MYCVRSLLRLLRTVRCVRTLTATAVITVGAQVPLLAMQVDPAELDQALGGTWEFRTVGTTPGMSSSPQQYTQTRRIHFSHGAFDQNPLGFTSGGFQLRRYARGGSTSFETPYAIGGGGSYGMSFTGALSADGATFQGTFTFCMASGTVTAIREAVVPVDAAPSVAIGSQGSLALHLTLRPDQTVAVHGARTHGDKAIVVAADPVRFEASHWDQAQAISIDARAVTHTGTLVLHLAGDGVPDADIAIRLVRPRHADPAHASPAR